MKNIFLILYVIKKDKSEKIKSFLYLFFNIYNWRETRIR